MRFKDMSVTYVLRPDWLLSDASVFVTNGCFRSLELDWLLWRFELWDESENVLVCLTEVDQVWWGVHCKNKVYFEDFSSHRLFLEGYSCDKHEITINLDILKIRPLWARPERPELPVGLSRALLGWALRLRSSHGFRAVCDASLLFSFWFCSCETPSEQHCCVNFTEIFSWVFLSEFGQEFKTPWSDEGIIAPIKPHHSVKLWG